MVFDAEKFNQLYINMINEEVDEDYAIGELMQLLEDLIDVIAISLNKYQKDDLVSVGTLKALKLLRAKKLKVNRGDTYSFFSFVLRNAMIDYLRKEGRQAKDELDDEFADTQDYEAIVDYSCDIDSYFIDYISSRYGIHRTVCEEAITYILRARHEDVYGKSRGTVKSLSVVYDIEDAYRFYKTVIAYLDCKTLDIDTHCFNVDGLEGYISDICMIIGKRRLAVILNLVGGKSISFPKRV